MEFDPFVFGRLLVGLIAVVNPIGAVPIYLALTEARNDFDSKKMVKSTTVTVALTLLISAFLGKFILAFFGISIPAFRVAGGILIMMMGLQMLQAYTSRTKHRTEEAEEAQSRERISVVPLGIPLLAGPGSITLVIVEGEKAFQQPLHLFALLVSIIGVSVIVYLCLNAAPMIAKRLGKTGVNVFTRIMGLIITAIAVEFMVSGIGRLLPGLAN